MEKEKNAHSLKILLVEDNKSDAMLIREMLYEAADTKREDFHYELISKGRLGDAMDYLGENTVDVILLDLSMPDSSSSYTVRKILDRQKNTPVIVLTGLDDETATIQALQNGAQDYLKKTRPTAYCLFVL